MTVLHHTWAIILAGGDGSRLRALTTNESGVAVPKQFCSLRNGRSLLHEALARAQAVASPEHICVVVAAQHRRWWLPALAGVVNTNIIVQPENRGTAIGILLPLLHILARDPSARIVLLPSDHHVHDEPVLAAALQRGARELYKGCTRVLLLGISPDDADPELGYILPGPLRESGPSAVIQFVEKPDPAEARSLIEAGALWNAFIVMAKADTLLQVFAKKFPQTVANMQKAVALDVEFPGRPDATAVLYQTLPHIDFSHHVLAGEESALGVLPVEHCGWTDLGTPQRVAQTLERFPASTGRFWGSSGIPAPGFLNLARQQARMMARAGTDPQCRNF